VELRRPRQPLSEQPMSHEAPGEDDRSFPEFCEQAVMSLQDSLTLFQENITQTILGLIYF